MVKWISTASGIFLTLAAVLAFWGSYGWITREAYAVDEQKEETIHQGQATQSSIDALTAMVGVAIEQQEMNHTEWKCDEASEAIIDLQMDIEDEQDRRKKYTLQVDMTAQVGNMAKWDCGQFEN